MPSRGPRATVEGMNVRYTRLSSATDGTSRFDDVDVPLGPGDVLLAEDVDGIGHASRTTEGFTAVVVVLD